MTTLTHNATFDLGTRGLAQKTFGAAIAAIRAAVARAKARREYRYMLEACDDHILNDIGLSRDAIRQAYEACGHRG